MKHIKLYEQFVNERTFEDGQIAIYDGEDGETYIEKRGKGYYGYNDRFDFEAKDKAELEKKLKSWKYELVSGSIDEATDEANDHEVGMAQGQLEAICQAATELQQKVGLEEKDMPAWIQSHITSAYEYLKQANDNFHELQEDQTNEALKMVMDPLMVKIMKNFSFKADPAIRAELRDEIKAAVKQVLQKHDIIVEDNDSNNTEA